MYLRSCYSIRSEPEARQFFASHAESAILPPFHLVFLLGVPSVGPGRRAFGSSVEQQIHLLYVARLDEIGGP